MNERALRRALRNLNVPGEHEARERAWPIVRAAFEAREPRPEHHRYTKPVLAIALAVALLAGALSSPGRAVFGNLRDHVVGEKQAAPALFSLPTGGRLLVDSSAGPWVVQRDGSKRLLGRYEGATWSPHGKYLAVWRGHELSAVTPHGDPRWSLERRGRVRDARWSNEGYRVAYLAGPTLRVTIGNGTGDHLFDSAVASVAPAWLPRVTAHVLAYVRADGRIRLVDVDSRDTLWLADSGIPVRQLAWSWDGQRLLVLGPAGLRVLSGRGHLVGSLSLPGAAAVVPSPRSSAFAIVQRAANGTSRVVLGDSADPAAPLRRLFARPGAFSGISWSPDGRWLLLAWPTADQWLFLRSTRARKPPAVANVSREFHSTSFPRLVGWCC